MNTYNQLALSRKTFIGCFTALALIFMLIATNAMAISSDKRQASRERIMDMVVEEAIKADFPPELALAVARVESNFDAKALSPVGARGVMQIMPKTARDEFGVAASKLYQPRTNIRLGIRFLRQLMNRYDNYVDIALSHYNGGSRVRTSYGTLRVIPATRDYVTKVMAYRVDYRSHPKVMLAKRGVKAKQTKPHQWQPSRAIKVAGLDDFSDTDSRIHQLLAKRQLQKRHGEVAPTERERLIAKLKALSRHNKQRPYQGPSTYKLPLELENRQDKQALVASWESY